jgi:hypothetical protein
MEMTLSKMFYNLLYEKIKEENDVEEQKKQQAYRKITSVLGSNLKFSVMVTITSKDSRKGTILVAIKENEVICSIVPVNPYEEFKNENFLSDDEVKEHIRHVVKLTNANLGYFEGDNKNEGILRIWARQIYEFWHKQI